MRGVIMAGLMAVSGNANARCDLDTGYDDSMNLQPGDSIVVQVDTTTCGPYAVMWVEATTPEGSGRETIKLKATDGKEVCAYSMDGRLPVPADQKIWTVSATNTGKEEQEVILSW